MSCSSKLNNTRITVQNCCNKHFEVETSLLLLLFSTLEIDFARAELHELAVKTQHSTEQRSDLSLI